MDKLLEKIYDEVICDEKDVTRMNKAIENNPPFFLVIV